MSMWPNKNDLDSRPVQGAAYKKIAPVAPNAPIVPSGAPAELHIK